MVGNEGRRNDGKISGGGEVRREKVNNKRRGSEEARGERKKKSQMRNEGRRSKR